MSKKLTESPRLARKAATRDVRPVLHVFCEGKVTEPEYLTAFYRQLKVKPTVLPKPRGGAGEPLTIVQKCITLRAELRRAIHRDRWRDIDQVWAVFDRDEHVYFDEAVLLAQAQDVKLAVSNPCIEIWGMLHGNDHCNRPMTRHEAQKSVRQVFPGYDHESGPIFDWNICASAWEQACVRGERGLLTRQEEGNDFPSGNPSSNFHYLLLAISGRKIDEWQRSAFTRVPRQR